MSQELINVAPPFPHFSIYLWVIIVSVPKIKPYILVVTAAADNDGTLFDV